MKKNILALLLIAFSISYSQESSLFNVFYPTFIKSVFSAGVDDASGVAINPAAVGFEQENNIFFNTTFHKNKINENLIYLNTRIFKFGLSLNFKNSTEYSRKNTLYSIGYGFGFGDEKFAFGFNLDNVWQNKSFSNIKTFYNLGFILRPIRYVSLSYSLLNAGWKNVAGRDIRATNIFGIGVRPLGTNRITLFFDYEYDTNLKIKEIPYKYGAQIKIANGLFVYGSLYDTRGINGKNYYLGLRFDFSHIGIDYRSAFNEAKDNNINNFSLYLNRAKKPSLVRGKIKIAEITIEGDYNDFDEPAGLFSRTKKGLQSLIGEIDRAANNDDVGGVLLNIKSFTTPYAILGMNSGLEELTSAILRVKAKGKPVVAFIESMGSLHEIYLAVCTDKIVLPQYGMLAGYGISYNNIKLKYALKKLGIDVRTYTAGKYKSSLNDLSDTLSIAKIEELNSLIDDLYEKMVEQIKTHRKLSDSIIDSLSGMMNSEQALNAGVIDMVGWYEDAKKEIYKMVKNKDIEKGEDVKTFKIAERKYWNEYWNSPDKIAIVGIYGTIVQGESQPPSLVPIPFLSSPRSTGSKTVIRQLEKALKDPCVKAIILRVDSPGGDGIASDDIYRAVVKAREKKTVIVSMGSLATSGGYYVSAHGAKVFANHTTLTGSIGVIAQIPFLYDLFQKYDVYTKSFNRGSFSEYFNFYVEPKPEAEKMLNDALNNFYEGFIKRISEGRKLSEEEVKLVAQGRIWTGKQAKERNLIDEFGSLYDAIQYVKQVCNLGDDTKIEYYSVPSYMFGVGSIISNLIK